MKKDFTGIVGVVLVGLILFAFSGTVYSFARGATAAVSVVRTSAEKDAAGVKTLVIDPGHGGEDGGAVARDGTLEKELDLAVAGNIDALSLLFGVRSVTTRTDDRLIDELPGAGGSRKSRDLLSRLRISEEADAALLLSVHVNKFPDPGVHGAQVYFSPNGEDSRRAAAIAQEYLNGYLQPDHTKEIKRADSAIFLLNRAKVPAILAECGFLSNDGDLDRLKTEEYRARVACVLFSAAAEYLNH